MKNARKIAMMAAALFSVLLFTQCSSESEDSSEVTVKDVKQEFNEAFEATKDHVDQKLDEFQQDRMTKRLEKTSTELEKKIVELETRLEERSQEDAAEEQIEKLKEMKADVNEELVSVKEATADSWEEMKKETKATCDQLETGIKQEVEKVEALLADNEK